MSGTIDEELQGRVVTETLQAIGLPPITDGIKGMLYEQDKPNIILEAAREAAHGSMGGNGHDNKGVKYIKRLFWRSGVVDMYGKPLVNRHGQPLGQQPQQASAEPAAPAAAAAPTSQASHSTREDQSARGYQPNPGQNQATAAQAQQAPRQQAPQRAPQRSAPARTTVSGSVVDMNRPESQASEGNSSPASIDRFSYHVYGGKAALCFEADTTRAGGYTVSIDAARAVQPRQYDWKDKVRVQLTQDELPVAAAVFLGVLSSCEYGLHGPNQDKGFSIERQSAGKVFCKVSAREQGTRAVPIDGPDVFRVNTLLMRQLKQNHPWLEASEIMALIRASIKDMEPPKRS